MILYGALRCKPLSVTEPPSSMCNGFLGCRICAGICTGESSVEVFQYLAAKASHRGASAGTAPVICRRVRIGTLTSHSAAGVIPGHTEIAATATKRPTTRQDFTCLLSRATCNPAKVSLLGHWCNLQPVLRDATALNPNP